MIMHNGKPSLAAGAGWLANFEDELRLVKGTKIHTTKGDVPQWHL